MMTIDGSQGEGGGQILRTSLALSLITRQAIRVEKIRAGRKKPGLLNQHLTAVNAAQTIGQATVNGAELGSQTLEFQPGNVTPGHYQFAVGTAGSAMLVLQTILPPLLIASGPSSLALTGGTHNPAAPPFDFLQQCFVPQMERMGPRIELQLHRPGFFPAGGGSVHARIEPVKQLSYVELHDRGEIKHRQARALISQLPTQIGEREIAVVRRELGWTEDECVVETVERPIGPGNALLLAFQTDTIAALFTGFGERGRSAEAVAQTAIAAAQAWLATDVPVDEHLADQLLLPMALAGGGSFRTTKPTPHSLTNAGVIERFLPVKIYFEAENALVWRVSIKTQ